MSLKQDISKIIANKEELIETINQKIWDFAELGLDEFKSAKLYTELLEKEGFNIEQNIAGMPTAFKASFGKGKPVIGITAEYDALPGLSQEAGVAEHIPLKTSSNGHGCGHNSLGAASFGAALAVKDYITENDITGTIILFGTPSEEKDNGKAFMARDGFFDDLDAAFTWHPMAENAAWGTSSLANLSVVFNFKGVTAHAAASPHLGRSALDSAEIMNIGVNYLREHVIPEARIHYAYLDVGGKAPNVVQATSSVHYFIRAPKSEQVLQIFERMKDVAKGAALICGTESSYEIQTGLSHFIPNPTLTKIIHESMVEYGAPQFDEKDFELARKFFLTLPKKEQDNIEKELIKKHGKEKAKEILQKPLPTEIEPLQISSVAMSGSTDVGDLSQVVPTAQFTMATTSMGINPHTWQMTAQGTTSIAMKGVKAAAGIMALTAIKVLEKPELAEKARVELNLETDGKYTSLIPEDMKPNV